MLAVLISLKAIGVLLQNFEKKSYIAANNAQQSCLFPWSRKIILFHHQHHLQLYALLICYNKIELMYLHADANVIA